MGYKLSDDDFKNQDSLDNAIEQLGGSNVSDENGYTPLCYIALNGNRSDLIVYLINDKDADASKVCDKGSTPLELACMSGNAEAVTALIGGSVIERDEDGNIIYTSDQKPDQPKKDAAGNPIPKRDSEDNIIYKKDACGTPYPLGYDEDPDSVVSVKPEIQYAEYKTEKDPFDENRVVVKSVRRIPPLLTKSVIYKYEKDGSHTPMRDIDGKPLKQYNKDSLQPINKKDEVTFNPIRNKYEYIWDYESQPEYEVSYCEKTTKISNKEHEANVTKKEILNASSNKDSSILIAMAEKYNKVWDTSGDEDTTFSDNYESPLIAACRMQAMDSINLILDKISTVSAPRQTLNNNVISAVLHSTKKLMDTSENVYSIAAGLKDETIFKSIDSHIEKLDDDNTFSVDIINKMISGTEENPAHYYKLLNLFKGVGNDPGKFTEDALNLVYDSIDDDILIIGTDEYTSLLESKWPARD